ncbi:MAG: TlpA family protein disulfide reductase [Candidatus Acidiferrales bacterium]
MLRKTDAIILRIALVALVGIFVLAYIEMSRHPRGSRGNGSSRALRNACPAPSAEPARANDLGAADYDWRLTALDGRELSLGEFQDKVVFLNVWATWCGPCRREMPAIQRLHDSVSGDGVALVLVSEEDAAEVRAYVEKGKYTFPVYLSAGAVPKMFNTGTIPATYVINPQGRVVFEHIGAAAWDSDVCQSFLRALQ